MMEYTMKKHIIFDFGGVLIDWHPDRVYLPYFNDDINLMKKFYDETHIRTLNLEFDRGLPFDHGLKQLAHDFPRYHEPIYLWKTEWHKMIGGPVEGSIKILRALHHQNYLLFGLTNWSAETFPYVYYLYDFFRCFKDIVVSGREKVIKPELKIYEILLSRNNLNAEHCILIDDNMDNIIAAKKLGIHGICFSSPEQLAEELKFLSKDSFRIANLL